MYCPANRNGIQVHSDTRPLWVRNLIAEKVCSAWKRGKCKAWTFYRVSYRCDGMTRYCRVEINVWGKRGKPLVCTVT